MHTKNTTEYKLNKYKTKTQNYNYCTNLGNVHDYKHLKYKYMVNKCNQSAGFNNLITKNVDTVIEITTHGLSAGTIEKVPNNVYLLFPDCPGMVNITLNEQILGSIFKDVYSENTPIQTFVKDINNSLLRNNNIELKKVTKYTLFNPNDEYIDTHILPDEKFFDNYISIHKNNIKKSISNYYELFDDENVYNFAQLLKNGKISHYNDFNDFRTKLRSLLFLPKSNETILNNITKPVAGAFLHNFLNIHSEFVNDAVARFLNLYNTNVQLQTFIKTVATNDIFNNDDNNKKFLEILIIILKIYVHFNKSELSLSKTVIDEAYKSIQSYIKIDIVNTIIGKNVDSILIKDQLNEVEKLREYYNYDNLQLQNLFINMHETIYYEIAKNLTTQNYFQNKIATLFLYDFAEMLGYIDVHTFEYKTLSEYLEHFSKLYPDEYIIIISQSCRCTDDVCVAELDYMLSQKKFNKNRGQIMQSLDNIKNAKVRNTLREHYKLAKISSYNLLDKIVNYLDTTQFPNYSAEYFGKISKTFNTNDIDDIKYTLTHHFEHINKNKIYTTIKLSHDLNTMLLEVMYLITHFTNIDNNFGIEALKKLTDDNYIRYLTYFLAYTFTDNGYNIYMLLDTFVEYMNVNDVFIKSYIVKKGAINMSEYKYVYIVDLVIDILISMFLLRIKIDMYLKNKLKLHELVPDFENIFITKQDEELIKKFFIETYDMTTINKINNTPYNPAN